MLFFVNPSRDTEYNLALEETLTKSLTEEIFFFWQNQPSIIIGRNQNTAAEINADFVREHKVKVVRRITGGGAVYHDLGNINYSYISNFDGGRTDFENFARPIMKTLGKFGINAEFSGRNDILIDGKKISGSAQSRIGNRILFHGTLLFKSDLAVLSHALRIEPGKIEGKGIKSIRSRVGNISDSFQNEIPVSEFIRMMSGEIKQYFSIGQDYEIPSELEHEAKRLADEKYRTWNWNYGNSPLFNFRKSVKFAGGRIELNMQINHGTIEAIKFYGDFFSRKNVLEIESSLLGKSNNPDEIELILSQFDIEEYFLLTKKTEILSLFE